ncbi:Uncharacterised protein [Mycobacteroides abscessus subsp. massiliense]|uniref:hypothetical protein n=1 Tax=Mycobacteroides abscessus TaxID=36809 RepID=UPI0009A90F06|nr:hypothetical protein [Mycobacteroides abscessus]SKM81647.1 Uncharacterised protein [Mycobacteroides abscessus subsp. massiliense]SKM98276.1 Uncharacterised protein [Mycobacteroides abscessus subsp. massiliense]SKN76974.1 Uncharacterised protein [Mycobacteroides abscessus subsp. massiliense]SKN96134.1 Uncharacterised protein [Mycobacteroides abscessus subsp. massiliense]SKO21742.1 Uncharacterised protein [Mycobacteroides abscessus subsp. massiliense]
MTANLEDLEDLERETAEKFYRLATALAGEAPLLDVKEWLGDKPFEVAPAQLPGALQFPQETWAVYPARRTVTLVTVSAWCDKAIDGTYTADVVRDGLPGIGLLLAYGGKERLS